MSIAQYDATEYTIKEFTGSITLPNDPCSPASTPIKNCYTNKDNATIRVTLRFEETTGVSSTWYCHIRVGETRYTESGIIVAAAPWSGKTTIIRTYTVPLTSDAIKVTVYNAEDSPGTVKCTYGKLEQIEG